MKKMRISLLVVFILFILTITIGFVKFPYITKSFMNKNLNSHYRLDIYPEFFDGNVEAFESAKSFNSGEINYQQYAIQRGYRIKVVPIVKRDVSIYENISGGGGVFSGTSGGAGGINIGGGGGGGNFPSHCTMEWYSVDENENMVSGPGGCY